MYWILSQANTAGSSNVDHDASLTSLSQMTYSLSRGDYTFRVREAFTLFTICSPHHQDKPMLTFLVNRDLDTTFGRSHNLQQKRIGTSLWRLYP